MQIATWISVIILGIGAPAIFVWFLVDMLRLAREQGERAATNLVNEPKSLDSEPS